MLCIYVNIICSSVAVMTVTLQILDGIHLGYGARTDALYLNVANSILKINYLNLGQNFFRQFF